MEKITLLITVKGQDYKSPKELVRDLKEVFRDEGFSVTIKILKEEKKGI